MKTRWIIVIITACMALMLYLRIALPFNHIFTGQWIKFSSVDAYWQMANVDRIAPDFPAYITQIFNVPFFQWLLSGIIWCLGLGNPTQTTIDTIAVYFPPILAALTVIPVYFIGKMLFNRFVGLVAVALIAVLPGEWLGRSLLGFTDHHVAEVLFSSTAIMFFLLALKTLGKPRIASSTLATLFIFTCVYSWSSGILIAAIAIIYLFIQVVLGKWQSTYYTASLIVLLFLLGAFLAENLSLIPTMWVYLTSSSTITTTLEMRPLFFPVKSFTPLAAWGNFTTLLFVVPIVISILLARAVKQRDSNAIFLLIWSIVMLIAMLCFRRFAYYFAINASLLGGFMAWYLWDRIKEKNLAFIITGLCIVIMIIPNFQVATVTARHSTFAPSDAWMKALEWTEKNTPEDSIILSWWDYGYWIEREADRKAYANPMQDKIPLTNMARMFLSESGNAEMDIDYIILDYQVVGGKFWAIAEWASADINDYVEYGVGLKPAYYETMVVKLYYLNAETLENYTLIYQSEEKVEGISEVKIFRKEVN